MSWKHKGVEINVNSEGQFTAEVTRGDDTIPLKAASLEELYPLITKALARTKKDDLSLKCLAYRGPGRLEGEITEVTLLGVSGTDSTFRVSPKVVDGFQLYPSHPAVRLMLEQLWDLETDLAKLGAKLESLRIPIPGYGRVDMVKLEVLAEKLTKQYNDALKAVEAL